MTLFTKFSSSSNFFILAILISLLCSCKRTYPATFSEAQPADVESLSKIPKILHGRYLDPVDSLELIIDEEIIKTSFTFKFKISNDDIKNTDKRSKDSVTNPETPYRITNTQDPDSVFIVDEYIDTIFHLSQNHIIKKFNGSFFISSKIDVAGWGVKRLEISKGNIVLSYLSDELDIESLSKITGRSLEPNGQNLITLTKKEFKSFVKDGGFRSRVNYVKMND
jgi:hypothetical protein